MLLLRIKFKLSQIINSFHIITLLSPPEQGSLHFKAKLFFTNCRGSSFKIPHNTRSIVLLRRLNATKKEGRGMRQRISEKTIVPFLDLTVQIGFSGSILHYCGGAISTDLVLLMKLMVGKTSTRKILLTIATKQKGWFCGQIGTSFAYGSIPQHINKTVAAQALLLRRNTGRTCKSIAILGMNLLGGKRRTFLARLAGSTKEFSRTWENVVPKRWCWGGGRSFSTNGDYPSLPPSHTHPSSEFSQCTVKTNLL